MLLQQANKPMEVTQYKSHAVFSYLYGWFCRHFDHSVFGKERQWLIQQCHGDILEIGCGTGINFQYYSNDCRLTAIEPDHSMLVQIPRAQKPNIKIIQAGAEHLPFDDNSFDFIVATLVFCTIPEPQQAIDEIRRVLRPSGRLLFMEHIASKKPLISTLQNLINPMWKKCAGGCHLDRKTLEILKDNQFSIFALKDRPPLGFGLLPVVYGCALSMKST